MTTPCQVEFQEQSSVDLAKLEGTIIVFADGDGGLIGAAAEIDQLTGGAAQTRWAAPLAWRSQIP